MADTNRKACMTNKLVWGFATQDRACWRNASQRGHHIHVHMNTCILIVTLTLTSTPAHLARHVGLVLPPPDRGFSVQLRARAAVVPFAAALGAGPRRRALVLGCCADTACPCDLLFGALHHERHHFRVRCRAGRMTVMMTWIISMFG